VEVTVSAESNSTIPRATVRKAFIVAVIIVIAAIVLAISAHVSMVKSEAFIAAENFLRTSHEVERLVGSIKQVSLSSTGESFINETGNDGRAKLSLTIVGTHATADSEIMLTGKLGVWSIVSASVKVEGTAAIVSLPIGTP
jgi:hypothetical protein